MNTASFRGINFFYQSTSEDYGFKHAEHVYPGSPNFQLEQLGLNRRLLKIEAIVRLQDRQAFDIALTNESAGLLVHPIYGTIEVKVGTFTKTDSK